MDVVVIFIIILLVLVVILFVFVDFALSQLALRDFAHL